MDVLANLKLPELKKECKARGLPITGNKADLVARLQAAMSTEKPPSDDSVLDDALIDEDSVLGDDDSGAEDGADLTDLISPTTKTAPVIQGSPVKMSEALKRPAPSSPVKAQTNGAGKSENSDGSPEKKKIIISREPVQPVVEPINVDATKSGSEDDKGVVKTGVPLTAEEKAKLRAQKFGTAASATPSADASVSKPIPAVAVAPITDERLKKRAERFNSSGTTAVATAEHKVISLTTEDDVKLAKRRERFGAPAEEDKTKKVTRAARFGVGAADASANPAETDEKKKLRAARFGNTS